MAAAAGDAGDHRRRGQGHVPADMLAEQRGGQGQAEEWLQQLQLPDGCDAALGHAAHQREADHLAGGDDR